MPILLPARSPCRPLFLLLATLAAAGAAAAQPAPTDFVSDGSFEQPAAAAWQGTPALPLANDGGTLATPFGRNAALLGPAARLEQALPLPAGAYTLTWSDAPRGSASPRDPAPVYRVSFAGTALAERRVAPGRRWSTHHVSFHAEGAGLLRFEAVGAPATGAAPPPVLIDAVGVTADAGLPVPGSYTMLLVGLGLLASATRGTGRAPFKR